MRRVSNGLKSLSVNTDPSSIFDVSGEDESFVSPSFWFCFYYTCFHFFAAILARLSLHDFCLCFLAEIVSIFSSMIGLGRTFASALVITCKGTMASSSVPDGITPTMLRFVFLGSGPGCGVLWGFLGQWTGKCVTIQPSQNLGAGLNWGYFLCKHSFYQWSVAQQL